MEVPRVRVLPASDALRRILKHPHGMAFRSTGSAEWPLDKYTQRRLADGSVTLEEKREKAETHHGGRQHHSTS